jgi:FkbM family methyltransferase
MAARLVRTLLSPRRQREVAYEILRHDEGVELQIRRGDVTWTVDAGDAVGRGLFLDGHYELEAIEALIEWSDRVARPRVVVDIGANVGSTTVPFARAGFHVLAVEPVPHTFAMLEANVRDNGLDEQVRCFQAAITSTTGPVPMWTSGASGLNELFVEGERPVFTRTGRTPVDLISVAGNGLTDLVLGAGVAPNAIGMVWCDAQGSETMVIETGAELWAAGVPIYLEIDVGNLEGHGGAARFVEAAGDHFTAFLPAEAVLERRWDVLPIHGFEDYVGALTGRTANALLLA